MFRHIDPSYAVFPGQGQLERVQCFNGKLSYLVLISSRSTAND